MNTLKDHYGPESGLTETLQTMGGLSTVSESIPVIGAQLSHALLQVIQRILKTAHFSFFFAHSSVSHYTCWERALTLTVTRTETVMGFCSFLAAGPGFWFLSTPLGLWCQLCQDWNLFEWLILSCPLSGVRYVVVLWGQMPSGSWLLLAVSSAFGMWFCLEQTITWCLMHCSNCN